MLPKPYNKLIFKVHQKILAGGFDGLDHASPQRSVFVHARQRGKDRLEPRDLVSRQRGVQGPRSAKDRVPFRHAALATGDPFP